MAPSALSRKWITLNLNSPLCSNVGTISTWKRYPSIYRSKMVMKLSHFFIIGISKLSKWHSYIETSPLNKKTTKNWLKGIQSRISRNWLLLSFDLFLAGIGRFSNQLYLMPLRINAYLQTVQYQQSGLPPQQTFPDLHLLHFASRRQLQFESLDDFTLFISFIDKPSASKWFNVMFTLSNAPNMPIQLTSLHNLCVCSHNGKS